MNTKQIETIKETITKNVSPEKIILFGSYATGNPSSESDIDLVVIWNTTLNFHERNMHLSRLFPKRNFSLDIFAFTREEADKMKEIEGTILYEAFHHGKTIYGE